MGYRNRKGGGYHCRCWECGALQRVRRDDWPSRTLATDATKEAGLRFLWDRPLLGKRPPVPMRPECKRCGQRTVERIGRAAFGVAIKGTRQDRGRMQPWG